jgi:Putative DNA-binding domain
VLTLVDYQRQVAAALLGRDGRSETAEDEFSTAGRPGLKVHQGTVFRALVKALRLTFPTIVQLTGESFFERIARGYIRSHPPLTAVLYDYGSAFPAYLATCAPLERYPYFPDVASFDSCMDRASHFDPTTFGRTIVLAKGLRFRLSASLMCLQTSYPADKIRDSLAAGRSQGLGNLDVTPQSCHFALWRSREGASVRHLSLRASLFLQAILAKPDVIGALRRSTGGSAYGRAAAALHDEIVSNSFARASSGAEFD